MKSRHTHFGYFFYSSIIDPPHMHSMPCSVCVAVECPSVCLSRRSTSAPCRSPGAGSRYRSIAAGAQAADAGSRELAGERYETQHTRRVVFTNKKKSQPKSTGKDDINCIPRFKAATGSELIVSQQCQCQCHCGV